jgi:GT2 family glycosyltransferase
MKTVTIVIPCFNENEYIIRCLDSIDKQTYPKEHITTFICDGNSTDGTQELVRDYASKNNRFQLLINAHKTTPHALNLGIRNSKSDVVVILGAHSELDMDFVKKSLETFSINGNIMCVGGILENVYANDISKTIGYAMSSPFGVGNAHFRTGTKKGFVDTVAFGAYRKEIFEKVGLFNEELIRNQDDEFNYRVTSAGYKIYLNPEIKCKYFVRASYGKLFRQYYQYGYWKVYVNRLHKTVTTGRQLIPALFVLYLLVFPISFFISGPVAIYSSLILFLYLVFAITFASIKHSNPLVMMKITFTFLILHLGYGIGYLKGILDFLILGRSIRKTETLSR